MLRVLLTAQRKLAELHRPRLTDPILMSPTIVLRCHAPHPDPRRPGEQCGTPLSHAVRAEYEWTGIVRRMPEAPDGHVYKCCPRKTCRAVNAFRVIRPAVAEPMPDG